MKRLALEDILDRERYAGLRTSYRAAVIDYKRSRRLAAGENITLLFEDRETLLFQVQEMVWVEGIALPEKIQYEIDTYNELMPTERELSATLFIEITEAAEIRAELDRLIGVDEHVSLIVGEEREAVESFLTIEDDLLAELMTAVKRAAQEIVQVHGACRVHMDIGGHSNGLRWHVYAPPS